MTGQRHDSSVAESSDTLQYTPASSTTGDLYPDSLVSAETESEMEDTALLEEQPPAYDFCYDDKKTMNCPTVEGAIDTKKLDGSDLPEHRRKTRTYRRARCRRVCLFMILKVVFLVGALGWVFCSFSSGHWVLPPSPSRSS